MTEDKLKPCPFCGSKAVICKSGNSYSVACNKSPERGYGHTCLSAMNPSTGYYKTKGDAVKLWNTRKGGENETD